MPTYHSFPRTTPKHCEYNQFGLEVLKSIVDTGLVLTPEFIGFDEYYENGEAATLTIGQKRLCLTDIEQSRLQEHCRLFGRFSIEFSHSAALEMGAMPVFYFPEVVKDAPGLSNLSGTLICRIAETVDLLKALERIRKAAAAADPSQPLVVTQSESGESVRLDVASTVRLLQHIDKKYRGFHALSANLRALGQLFSPTHDSSYTDALAYYRQREWRIISDIAAHGMRTSCELTAAQKKLLVHTNPDFFEKTIDTFEGQRRRVDLCRVYVDPAGEHPLLRATAVVVPSTVTDEARALLHAAGFSVDVLALESSRFETPKGAS